MTEISAEASVKGNEMVAEVIAGPETAARLGVPVGTVIEARYAATPSDGSPSIGRVISPEQAKSIRERITGRKEK